MNTIDVSFCIARQLAELWQLHRNPLFFDYISSVYHVEISDFPRIECVYIAEAEIGDLETGSIGGIIKHWWMVNDNGINPIRRPELSNYDLSGFDPRPIIRFYRQDSQLLVGERLGPTLICRKVGNITLLDQDVKISELAVIWTSSDKPEKEA